MTNLQKAAEHVAIHRYATVDNTGRILTADQEARAEIVKLKQEVAELHAAVVKIEGAVADEVTDSGGWYGGTRLKPLDDGWGHAEDGWPFDVSDSICICEREKERTDVSTVTGWRCSVHGDVLWQS